MSMTDYTASAASLFNNMRTPASIIAGSMVPIGLLSPLKLEPEDGDGSVAIFLRRVYPMVSVLSLCSQLLSVMWATVAVNELTETKMEVASSVWHLIQRDLSLPWVATNAHFVIGMMGFMWVLSSRAYFMAGKGLEGASAAGVAFSSLLMSISIVNRRVAAGGGDGLRFGSNVLALFSTYFLKLLQRACSVEGFGPLEFSAILLFTISLGNGLRIIVGDILSKKRP